MTNLSVPTPNSKHCIKNGQVAEIALVETSFSTTIKLDRNNICSNTEIMFEENKDNIVNFNKTMSFGDGFGVEILYQ